jgi:galactokinase
MHPLETLVNQTFTEKFNQKPVVYRSPGRVNLIGEHTDYNGGFVLPAATDKCVYIALAPAESKVSTWYSADLNDAVEIDFTVLPTKTEKQWTNYLLGVVNELKLLGCDVQAFNCVVAGDVPIGSGMSSSAALEAAASFALNAEQDFGLSRQDLALLCQRVEHKYIGVQCGIMDMFASIHGRANHALLLNCETLEYQLFPIELGDYKIVLFDTRVKHNLVDSEYNQRRQQCNEGLAFFRKHFDENIQNLSAVPLAYLQASRSQLDPTVYARCQYVIEENARILAACEDLQASRLKEFGIKMTATHEGLSKLYDVSCPELDFLVEALWHNEAVLGSRMMGGGFGGCTINIIHKEAIEGIFEKLSIDYKAFSGNELKMYSVVTADGSSIC